MALRRAFPVAPTYNDEETVGESLLNHAPPSMREEELPFLPASMTEPVKARWSVDKTFADHSADSKDLALENLSPSEHFDDANLRAQGHEAVLQRSFSPLAAIGLGFR